MLVLFCLQGDEIASISLENPEFEGITAEEEPFVSEYEDEDDAAEQQQEIGVLEGAPDTEASGASAAAAADGAAEAAEADAEAPAAAGEGSGAEGGAGEDEDDDGFVKVIWQI
jgi:hypothetical protein